MHIRVTAACFAFALGSVASSSLAEPNAGETPVKTDRMAGAQEDVVPLPDGRLVAEALLPPFEVVVQDTADPLANGREAAEAMEPAFEVAVQDTAEPVTDTNEPAAPMELPFEVDVQEDTEPLADARDGVAATEPPSEIAEQEPAEPFGDAQDVAYGVEPTSEVAIQMANWVVATSDNEGLPFMVIDKVAAEVLVFDAQGQILGMTPALLGIAIGDDSSPGVGDRELSDISPEDRTTPAGRFVAKFGIGSGDREVLWVDYTTSVSLHSVVTGNRKERRLQRLKSPSPQDNRITYGCINVSAGFYAKVVQPLFKEAAGVVYILPEAKSLAEVFPAFEAQPQWAALGDTSY
jgi:hypothetical protein